MKKSTIKTLPLTACTLAMTALASMAAHAQSDPLKAFPAAEPGYQRIVIKLPPVKNPDLYRVQLIPGKVIDADCNTRGLRGEIDEETVKGWGYNYWKVEKVGPGPTTMMACPPGTSSRKFVPVYSDDDLIRYNSKLPVVVYVPNDVELRYKIWRAPEKAKVGSVE
ncbi:serine protease inhibitor ecotin [Chitinibacter sp. FCG-7]|uniref:Serine protease inhibitor ecotin n=1 Tax=Chitinibacter mangrovi TaxID=3153927 RepID=A0AAU7F5E6_9NEIS